MNQQKERSFDYQKMESFFSNISLFDFIWKWKWIFIITAIVTSIVTIIFSGASFITPKFKAETYIYPINLNEYSDESATEQMLQMLQSTDIKFKLIEEFDLFENYKINPEAPFAQTYIFDELNDHVTFSKTSYESVRITVLDKDPQKAADMANALNTYYNELEKSLRDGRTKERIERDKSEMKHIAIENDSLKIKLKKLRRDINIVKPNKQTREITEAYLKNSSTAGKMYKNLIEYRDEIIFLDSLVTYNNKRYFEYKNDHDEQMTELNRNQAFSAVISKAIPADKKSYPVRWLIIAGALISTFVLCFIVLMILESIKGKKV